MENWKDLNIGILLTKGFEVLKAANIESYRLDCQLLLAKVLKKDKLFIMINREFNVTKEEVEEYFRLINIRKNKMPIKYMLGECEFMGLDFKIKQGVLIPRPDTEILVQSAIEDVKKNSYKYICDVCCGSGVIGISIAKFTKNTLVDCLTLTKYLWK